MLYIYIRAVQLIKIQFRFWSPENAYCAPFYPPFQWCAFIPPKKEQFHVQISKSCNFS